MESASVLVGQSVGQLQLPADTLIIAIARNSETIIPRGHTRLENGDCLQILVRDDGIAQLHEHLASMHRTVATTENASPPDQVS